MDRRTFLAAGAGAAAGFALTPGGLLAQPGTRDAELNAAFDEIFRRAVARSPELASSLGLDRGPGAPLKHRLSPRTAEERARQIAQVKEALARLAAFDPKTLSPAAQLNLEVVRYSLTSQTAAADRFGIDSVIRPYRIFQQGGAYFSVPDFLNTAHTINTAEDCEAYLDRLLSFLRRPPRVS